MKPITFTHEHKRWQVKQKSGLRSEGDTIEGITDYDAKIIWLEKDVSPEVKRSTLIHELLHLAYPFLSEESTIMGERLLNRILVRFDKGNRE